MASSRAWGSTVIRVLKRSNPMAVIWFMRPFLSPTAGEMQVIETAVRMFSRFAPRFHTIELNVLRHKDGYFENV
jgi:hypothetical protein